MAKFEIWGRRPAAAKSDVSEKLGEVKPADPLTGWAIRVVNGEVTAANDEAEVRIYKDGTLAIIGYPCEEPPVAVDAIEALIALWRETQP